MNTQKLRLSLLVLPCLAGLAAPGGAGAQSAAPETVDRLWMHRNLGAAYLANDSFEEATLELVRAAELAGESHGDRFNAGVAALLAGDLPAAREWLDAARELDPESPETAYASGILQKREGDLEGARATLLRCRELGGDGPELSYNLGILAVRLREDDAALAEFDSIVKLGADGAPRHFASALYRYGRTVLRSDREAGKAALSRYQELVRAGQGAELSEEDLEVGHLLDPVTFERPANVRAASTLPAFALSPLPHDDEIRWADVRDLDGDGDNDLLYGNGQTIADLRRQGDEWIDVTASRGLAGLLGVSMARAIDVDGDGEVDLVRSGAGGIFVHAGRQAAWDPPLVVSRTAASAFLPLDFDHDGDVDFLSSGPTGVALAQNDGARAFTDVTEAAGLSGIDGAVSAAAGDLDRDDAVDAVVVTRKGQVLVAANLRGGRFALSAPLPQVPDGVFDVDLADFDADGHLDLALASARGVHVVRGDGARSFEPSGPPAVEGTVVWPPSGGAALWSGDLDNDGLIDLVAAREKGATVAMNEGNLRFFEASEPAGPLSRERVHPVALALVDGDGRLDLVTSRGKFGIARNVGETGQSLVLRPVGVKNNRDGVGAIFELLAGNRYSRVDGEGGPVHFGLGPDGRIDALRVQWPNGIQQGILDAAAGTVIEVEEKAGLVGSCPFLYTWNGEAFVYVTDILTVTPLGLPVVPGTYVPPDHDEAIRVTADQLAPDAAGDLVVQVTEELREVTYLDQVRLYAIDHVAGSEVQPNEKFKFPPFPEFGVHVLEDPRVPVRAVDHRGRDVTETLLFEDDLVVGDLELTRYQGIVEPHTVEIDFGPVPTDAPLTLHLTGWFYWTNASINIAVSQDPRHGFVPPQLAIRGDDGVWHDSDIEVGFPGGKTKTIPVDLTGLVPDSGRLAIRLTTSLRLYWDRALLQVGAPSFEPRVQMVLPDRADLHYRGHSEPILSPDGESPERFAYDRMREGEPPWDQHPGLYTRYGDVTELVQEPEDMYVIMASGDECTVRWRADRIRAPEPGWERTWFLVFDGWAKDGDPNTTWSRSVEPLPFHGMSGYPYGKTETYPTDAEHTAYREAWNTRQSVRLTRDYAAAAGTSAPSRGPTPQTR